MLHVDRPPLSLFSIQVGLRDPKPIHGSTCRVPKTVSWVEVDVTADPSISVSTERESSLCLAHFPKGCKDLLDTLNPFISASCGAYPNLP